MTTIVRVKRHRGEDPVEALILSCKRKKTESNSSDSNSLKYILNFSGTVEEKDDKIAASTVESFRKDSSKYSNLKNKEHVPDIKTKQRKEWKERTDDNRFTLLSCLRSSSTFPNADTDSKGDTQKNITIVDVSKGNNENLTALSSSEGSFVYDLYTANVESDSDYNDMFMEHLLSVQPFQSELHCRNEEDCYDESDPDEDDSNDENNWRNDYPDSDSYENEDDSNDDDVLARQLNRFHLNNQDRETSSEEGDEDFLNYNDDEKYCYYQAEDLAGKRYARYKANAMKQIINDEEDEEDDSGEEYLDCEDSFYGNSD